MEVRFTTDEHGRAVCEKRAQDAAEAARVRREADLLEVAGHPGLVELLALEDEPAGTRLRTVLVTGTTLVDEDRLEAEEVAGLAAALSSTVADLHGMGLVHGALCPEHVLLDEDGRPVLCSLGYGGLAGERPAAPELPAAFVDQTRQDDDRLHPAIDVYGLGAILAALVSRPDERASRAAAENLRRLAARAMAPVRDHRPTARELSDAVHDTVRGARLPRRARPPAAAPATGPPEARHQQPLERWRTAQGPTRPRSLRPLGGRRRWGRAIVAATAVMSVGAVGMVLFRGRAPAGDKPEAARAPTTVRRTVATSVSTTAAAPVRQPTAPEPVRAGCHPVDGPLSADVDGDGCAERVRYADGVVEVGAQRWAVGQPGDLAAVGDWSCAGFRALALLRPLTGEVFAFDGWASSEREAVAPLVGRVGGARSVRASDLDGDGCHELVVERVTGAPTILRVPRSGP